MLRSSEAHKWDPAFKEVHFERSEKVPIYIWLSKWRKIQHFKMLFIFNFYVSVNSKPDHPPGNIFDGRIPHPPGKKEFKTPTSRAYENELKSHPGAFFSIVYCKNMKK